MHRLLAGLLAVLPLAAAADEGMWTYNNFPASAVQSAYGFQPTDAWLDKARLSSARLAQGCSASFVSATGLVMTNHHCAHDCIEQLSTRERDYVKAGFYARTQAEEVRCPQVEVNQLVAITDVTARMTSATEGKSGRDFFLAQRKEQSTIEKACQTDDSLRCEVVSLYRGGVYDLYTYRRYQDVRLVFAPEFAIAFFGGDPDNFTFPRYDLDLAFLRVYQDGRPAPVKDHFTWSAAGAREGQLTFVSGHPGASSRKLTVAQLEHQRDVALPERLLSVAELRGRLLEYQQRGPEQARHSNATLFYVENSYKALYGRWQALLDKEFFASRVRAERAFRAALERDPAQARLVLPAFDAIAGATALTWKQSRQLEFKEKMDGGDLLTHARHLVRAAAERVKPNADRLKEYADAALPELAQEVLAEAPVHAEFEVFRLTHFLTKLRERLGAGDPFTRKVLGQKSPAELAGELVRGSRLGDAALRQALWDGGQKAVEEAARADTMIAFALRVDEDGRAVRAMRDEAIQPVLTKNQELLARARFAIEGTSTYPDATFTLRLSYGAVKGYEEDGQPVNPITTFAGAFDRHTGREPFALPRSWLEARPKLDLATPFNFVSTNDIIGGNSGSPVFDRDLQIVGLVFDGNLQSLGGDYGFDAAVNRTVSVHSSAILEALARIYGADRLVRELRPAKVSKK